MMNLEKFPNSISVWLFIQCVNVILNLLIFKTKEKVHVIINDVIIFHILHEVNK